MRGYAWGHGGIRVQATLEYGLGALFGLCGTWPWKWKEWAGGSKGREGM